MEYKRKLELAEELLRDSFGYDGGNHTENLSFDFSRICAGIEVYNKNGGTFYWPEVVIKVAKAVGLSVFCDAEIADGQINTRMVIC